MDQERLSLLALRLIPGVGDRLFKQLVESIGSASEIFKLPASKLMRIDGIGDITARSIKKSKTFKEAEIQFRKAEMSQSRICFYQDPSYPGRLKELADGPSVLFIKGNMNLNHKRMVAIVGTRKATNYGKSITWEFIEGLKEYQTVVVSGLAYGIDIQAHLACLDKDIPTIGIMGSGLDCIYPIAHRNIAEKMLHQGALVTEEPFGSGPDAHHFPARNRIIAGLCDALVVVEAGEKGGALITADIMNSYNREVFAIPGSIHNSWSAGCNRLIRDHQAQLITNAFDLVSFLNWSGSNDRAQPGVSIELGGHLLNHIDPVSANILSSFSSRKALSVDELQFLTGLSSGHLASKLLLLELEGRLMALPGKQYQLRK